MIYARSLIFSTPLESYEIIIKRLQKNLHHPEEKISRKYKYNLSHLFLLEGNNMFSFKKLLAFNNT